MHRALMRDNYPPLSRRVGDFSLPSPSHLCPFPEILSRILIYLFFCPIFDPFYKIFLQNLHKNVIILPKYLHNWTKSSNFVHSNDKTEQRG